MPLCPLPGILLFWFLLSWFILQKTPRNTVIQSLIQLHSLPSLFQAYRRVTWRRNEGFTCSLMTVCVSPWSVCSRLVVESRLNLWQQDWRYWVKHHTLLHYSEHFLQELYVLWKKKRVLHKNKMPDRPMGLPQIHVDSNDGNSGS